MITQKRYDFLRIGIEINEIVNSDLAKFAAFQNRKVIQQVRRFEEERDNLRYEKSYAWWERYCFSTARYFEKFGDCFPIMKPMRKLIEFLKNFGAIR